VTTTTKPDAVHAIVLKRRKGHRGLISIPQTPSSTLSAAPISPRITREAVSVDVGSAQEISHLVKRDDPRVMIVEDRKNKEAVRQFVKKLNERGIKLDLSQARYEEMSHAERAKHRDEAREVISIAQTLVDLKTQDAKQLATTE
jgi:long-subunit acyl-CoA synthetase (AMP-forming)